MPHRRNCGFVGIGGRSSTMTTKRMGAIELLPLVAALGGIALLSGTARSVSLWLAIAAVAASMTWLRKQGRGIHR